MSKVNCPVCEVPVPADELEAHANACLDAKQQAPPPAYIVTADDASLLHAPTPEPTKTWSSSLFDCHTHVYSCLLSLCCPAIQFSVTQARAFPETRLGCLGWFGILVLIKLAVFAPFFTHPEAMQAYYEREDPMVFDVIRARIAFYSTLAFVGVFTYRRMQMRAKFGIRGSCLGDMCTMLWCTCCGLAQEYRQVEHEEERAAAAVTAIAQARLAESAPVEAIPVAKEV